MKRERVARAAASDHGLPMAILLWVLLATSLVGTACTRDQDGDEDEKLKIGLIVDREATAGHEALDAATLAFEETRERGGIPRPEGRRELELVIQSVSTPEESLVAARRLVSTGVIAMVGPSISRHAIPVATVADFAQVPMISPKSTHPLTTRDKRFAFRVAFTDDLQGRVLARFARTHLEIRRVAILFDDASDYNRHIARVFDDAFTTLGGEISSAVSYATGETDFVPLVEELLAGEPELVFLPNYQDEVVLQARRLRERGFTGILLGGDGWEPGETADPALENSYFCRHWYAVGVGASSRTPAFAAAFEARFGRPPDDVAALTYDAFGLLFETLEHSERLEPSALRDHLASIAGFPGVTGEITYRGGRGDPEKPVLIFRITPGGRSELFAAATGGGAMERETLDLSPGPRNEP